MTFRSMLCSSMVHSLLELAWCCFTMDRKSKGTSVSLLFLVYLTVPVTPKCLSITLRQIPITTWLENPICSLMKLNSMVMKFTVTQEGIPTYLSDRRQINLIIYLCVCTCLYQLVYLMLKYRFIKEQFKFDGLQTFPITTTSQTLHFVYMILAIISIMMNYLAFYFIIRKSFEVFSPLESDSLWRKSVFSDESFSKRNIKERSRKAIDEFYK